MAEDPYERFKIKVYDNWGLFLHINQYPYIGRCYAACNREEANHLSDMLKVEREEMFDLVVPEWESAVKELYRHDRTNIASLGNTWNHLHWHLIPRYNSPRDVHGVLFEDPNPKGNYAPYPKKKLAEETLMEIVEDFKSRLQ